MIYNAYADTANGAFGISLNSAGHIFAHEGREIRRPAGRGDWLLFYVAKGTERFFLDSTCDAEAGSFVIFGPHERQEHLCIDKAAEFYYVHFSAPSGLDLLGLESSRVYSAKPSATVRELFEKIIDELQRKRPFYEKLCVCHLFHIIGRLARRIADQNNPNRRYADRIAFVVQGLNKEYNKNLSLDELATSCSMSKFHFLRIFKEIVGTSPLEYRTRIRIEHAKELLEDINLPIGEVGAQVGYSSAAYFCDAFKKNTGLSPSEYRKILQNPHT